MCIGKPGLSFIVLKPEVFSLRSWHLSALQEEDLPTRYLWLTPLITHELRSAVVKQLCVTRSDIDFDEDGKYTMSVFCFPT